MKRLCAAWMLLFTFTGHSQRSIPSYSLSVTCKKTTNVIFPYRIEKADIGSADVIGHKDQIMGNVLFLKAGRRDFAPTNLSVYTSDGKFYSFIVSYRDDPDTLNLSFVPDQKIPGVIMDSATSDKVDSDGIRVMTQPSFLHRKTKTEEVKAILKGIYLMDDLLWFRITLKNNSEIDYRPTYIRFSIRERKAGKRTAEQEVSPDVCWKMVQSVPGNQKGTLVFAIPSFTISKEKKLVFQMEEKKGERVILLDIPSKTILKARAFIQQ
jgi:conjugative transposon TraN protein